MAWSDAARAAAAEARRRRKKGLPWRSNREKAAFRPKTQKESKQHPLVHDLNTRFPTLGEMDAYISGLPTATLLKAVRALNTTSHAGAMTKAVRDSITKALKGRK